MIGFFLDGIKLIIQPYSDVSIQYTSDVYLSRKIKIGIIAHMEEIQNKLKDQKSRFDVILQKFVPDEFKKEIRELEAQTMKEGFWNDRNTARAISTQLSDKQKQLETLQTLDERIKNALEILGEVQMFEDLKTETSDIEKILSELELKLFLSKPHDESEAILSVHSGAGGVEAMDWASMLARMYQRYFDKKGWEYEITDTDSGEEAGIKTMSMIVHIPYGYGFLRNEAGTHRLVRLSPFNADSLRQTSFALVEVLPVIEDQNEIQINDSEVEFESYRSGGAGGQNVNKVNTAVRLKHIPTGLVVTAQTERSQLQNRENAMKLLMAKLWERKQKEEKQTQKELKGSNTQGSWGTQIRSYVLHPYKMVKDLRTQVETSNAENVLNGDLDKFIESNITQLNT